jgi:hypothetical protein
MANAAALNLPQCGAAATVKGAPTCYAMVEAKVAGLDYLSNYEAGNFVRVIMVPP